MELFSSDENRSLRLLNITAWMMEDMYKDGFNHSWIPPHLIGLLMNATLDESLLSNRRVSDPVFNVLIAVYTLLIVTGLCGNCLVVLAVIRKPTMRTLRNTFIINLAVSDLLLCLLTMPLTLMEILTKHWPLGNSVISCKIAGGLPAVSIFVSTISITVISLDRYQLIVYPTQDYLKKMGAIVGLVLVWTVSFFLAAPLFIYRILDHHLLAGPPVESVDYCFEQWPIVHGRALYSFGTIVIQYAAPIVTVSIAHARICRKLRLRHSLLLSMCKDSRKQNTEKRRLRKLNILLTAIAFIFAVCWMPLNVFNLVVDLYNPFSNDQAELMIIIYAVCHMLGMSSALANPLLYGYLNENFRQEFREIAASVIPCLSPRSQKNSHKRIQMNDHDGMPVSPSATQTAAVAPPSTGQQITCEITIDTNTPLKQTAL